MFPGSQHRVADATRTIFFYTEKEKRRLLLDKLDKQASAKHLLTVFLKRAL